jgi:hypothetical protein
MWDREARGGWWSRITITASSERWMIRFYSIFLIIGCLQGLRRLGRGARSGWVDENGTGFGIVIKFSKRRRGLVFF